jgi:hypothetical protein
MKLKPLSPTDMDRLTREQAEILSEPPRTVGDVLVALVVAGVLGMAVAVVTGVCLDAMGAPGGLLWSWAGRAGLLAASIGLAVWSIPWRQVRLALWWREARQVVAQAEFRKLEAYREIVTLRARISQLELALANAEQDRDEARRDVYRIEQEARAAANPNYVTSESITPQMVADARRMIQYWFASANTQEERRSLSRTEAGDAPYRWSQPRHRAAQSLLVKAGVLYINGTQPEITVEPLNVALRKLVDYVERVRAQEAAARASAAQAAQARYGAAVEI